MDRSYRFKSQWRGAMRRRVLARWGGHCAFFPWAGTDGKGRGMHMAHIIPAPLGPDDETNVAPMCPGHHRQFDAGRVTLQRRASLGISPPFIDAASPPAPEPDWDGLADGVLPDVTSTGLSGEIPEPLERANGSRPGREATSERPWRAQETPPSPEPGDPASALSLVCEGVFVGSTKNIRLFPGVSSRFVEGMRRFVEGST